MPQSQAWACVSIVVGHLAGGHRFGSNDVEGGEGGGREGGGGGGGGGGGSYV